MKYIEYWCNSGANAHSKRKGRVTLEELGFTEEEWASLSDGAKAEAVWDVAHQQYDWGFNEVF